MIYLASARCERYAKTVGGARPFTVYGTALASNSSMAKPRQADILLDNLDSVVFDSDIVRQWLSALAKRMKRTELAGKENVHIRKDHRIEIKEMVDGHRALERAMDALEPFRKMVHRREAADEDDGG